MGILDIIIVAVIVCAAIFALTYVAYHRDEGGCGGCTGDCGSCKKGAGKSEM